MIAFAANSLLCRMALDGDVADPAGFTIVRIVAGAITLVLLIVIRDRQWQFQRPNLPAVGSVVETAIADLESRLKELA